MDTLVEQRSSLGVSQTSSSDIVVSPSSGHVRNLIQLFSPEGILGSPRPDFTSPKSSVVRLQPATGSCRTSVLSSYPYATPRLANDSPYKTIYATPTTDCDTPPLLENTSPRVADLVNGYECTSGQLTNGLTKTRELSRSRRSLSPLSASSIHQPETTPILPLLPVMSSLDDTDSTLEYSVRNHCSQPTSIHQPTSATVPASASQPTTAPISSSTPSATNASITNNVTTAPTTTSSTPTSAQLPCSSTPVPDATPLNDAPVTTPVTLASPATIEFAVEDSVATEDPKHLLLDDNENLTNPVEFNAPSSDVDEPSSGPVRENVVDSPVIHTHTASANGMSTSPTNGMSTSPTNGMSTSPTNGMSTSPTNGTSTQPTNGMSTSSTSCTSTSPTTCTSTQPTNGMSTSPTNGTSTPPTNGTSTPPTNGTCTSTQPTNGTSTQPTNGMSTQPTNGMSTSPTTCTSTQLTNDTSLAEDVYNGDILLEQDRLQLVDTKRILEPWARDYDKAKDSQYYIRLMNDQKSHINSLCAATENILESCEINDEVAGIIRLTLGKARLVVKKRLTHFEQLCNNQINQKEGDQFYTKLEDLDGFWEVVLMQIDDIYFLFSEVEVLRLRNWELFESPKNVKTKVVTKTPNKSSKKAGKCRTKKECDKVAARDAARKRLIEMKRVARQQQQQQQQQTTETTSEQDVEIFIA